MVKTEHRHELNTNMYAHLLRRFREMVFYIFIYLFQYCEATIRPVISELNCDINIPHRFCHDQAGSISLAQEQNNNFLPS